MLLGLALSIMQKLANNFNPMPTPTIKDVMEACAKDAEADARRRGFALDYSEASLAQVDRILELFVPEGVRTPNSKAEEEQFWLLSKMYGGYIGQVVIKHMGGSWELDNLPEGSARIVLRSCGILGFPADKIYKRLTRDRFSCVGNYCRVLRAIVEHANKNAKNQ